MSPVIVRGSRLLRVNIRSADKIFYHGHRLLPFIKLLHIPVGLSWWRWFGVWTEANVHDLTQGEGGATFAWGSFSSFFLIFLAFI
jgi:hypothetical protein